MSNGIEFERQIIGYAIKELEQQKMSHSAFARLLWPEDAKESDYAVLSRWRRMRNGYTDGIPQRITVETAYNIAQALGYDFPTFIWKVAMHSESA